MGKKATAKTEVKADAPATDTAAEESEVKDKGEADQPAADGTGEGAPSEDEEKTDPSDDKPAESETEPEKKAYTVHGCNIRHNGKTYKEGSQIELTDEEASRLKKYLKR